MANTYKKPKIIVRVFDIMNHMMSIGKPDEAKAALEAFNAKKTIKFSDGVAEYFVPFHSINTLYKTVETEDATREDPYCK